MKTSNFLIHIIILSLILPPSLAQAALTTHGLCRSILSQALESRAKAHNRTNDAEVLKQLEQFVQFDLVSQLGQVVADEIAPTMENVDVSSEMPLDQQLEVAKRIKGILAFHQKTLDTEKKSDEKLVAVSLQGEEIAEFFNGVEEKKIEANRLNLYTKNHNVDGVKNNREEFSNYMFAVIYSLFLMNWVNEGPSISTWYDGFLLFFSYQFLKGGTLYKEFFKEKLFGKQKTYSKFLDSIEKGYKENKQGFWHYLSFDMNLPTLYQKNLLNPNAFKDIGYYHDFDFLDRSSFLWRILAKKYMYSLDKISLEELKPRWAGVDLFFHNDARYEEPQLIVVFRTQTKKPEAPQKQIEKSKTKDKNLSSGKLPEAI